MWLLNKKTIILNLEKLSYNTWDEVKWTIEFDFWEDIIKADKITIWLNRKISSNSLKIWNWISSHSSNQYNYLLETNILAKWEYIKEKIPFNFIIPNNSIQDDISFSKILEKIPKWLRPIAEILIDMFAPNMRKRYSYWNNC